MTAPVLLWFRQDLRLADNPALSAAVASGRPVIPLYILDDDEPALGGASRWWLHQSLAALEKSLATHGQRLILRRGPATAVLTSLIGETRADTIHWNRCYEPQAVARDTALKAMLAARGVAVHSQNAALLFEPWTVRTKGGSPFRVFTPFWRACLASPEPLRPEPAPARILASAAWPHSDALDDWGLLPTNPDWAGGLRASWTPGEAGATSRASAFLDQALNGYTRDRDRPDLAATSRLSPHLHFGEISPHALWHAVRMQAEAQNAVARDADKFLSELAWREFSHHLLFYTPDLPERNLRADFDRFPWRDDPNGFRAWTRGETGYPIVDAGMRELWTAGWMHNRTRMIAASFLVKDLLIDWRKGAAWFWDTLVDADRANNSASWQWVAGCGADAAPYFRIFNPVLQGEKFDPEGAYVRRWCPELAKLPARWIHRPFEAPAAILGEAGVRLGTNYATPIVDHGRARSRALAAFDTIKARAA